jgi:Rieske Fe-S protein
VGIGVTAANSAKGTAGPTQTVTPIYGAALSIEGATTWLPVATQAQVNAGVVRFATESVTGYLVRSDGDNTSGSDYSPGYKSTILAFSAACTHMGCIVQWQESDRMFHCPCHGGLFTEYGQPSTGGALKYLAPLYQMEVMIKDGNVYVKVPAKTL